MPVTGRIGEGTRSRKSCGPGRDGWQRSGRRRHDWRRPNERRIGPGDGNRDRTGLRSVGVAISRPMGNQHPKAQSNFTDPESGILHTSAEGFQQYYNAQATVNGANQVIVSTQVTADASDQG